MTSERRTEGRLVVGGVVYTSRNGSRLRRNPPLIAIVRRRTNLGRDEWVLPQGEVLDSDRTMRNAAVRVVSAEVSCEVSSSRFADVVDHPLGDGARTALFWVMEPTEAHSHETHADTRVRWVPVDEAAALLAHPGERDLLRFAPRRGYSDTAAGTRRPRFGTRRNDPRLRRLVEEIGDLAAELHEAPSGGLDSAADQAAIRLAAEHIRRARQAAAIGDVDTGWGQAFRAREALVARMSEDEVVDTAVALQAEVVASDKIKQWRQDAVANLVKPILEGEARSDAQPKATREALREALRIRNESFSNEYHKLTILRRHQKHLLWIGVGALALVLALLSTIDIGTLPKPVDDRLLAFAALAMGVVGAVVSAAQRSTSVPQLRIPQAYTSYVASLSRIAIGGIAGLLVVLAATAVDGPLSQPSVLIGAFGAGFAERLVTEKPTS